MYYKYKIHNCTLNKNKIVNTFYTDYIIKYFRYTGLNKIYININFIFF